MDALQQAAECLKTLAHPHRLRIVQMLLQGQYTVGELAGKKFAAMDFDKAQAIMIESVGASPVSVSLTNFGSMFNNGSVDIIGAPAVAYDALELYKGLGDDGAIVNFSIIQLTAQIVARHDRFPEGFGQSSRNYAWSQYGKAMKVVNAAEKSIKPSYWLPAGKRQGRLHGNVPSIPPEVKRSGSI